MATIQDKPTTDDVVLEVRKIKEQLAEAFDFDIDRILADARERQGQSGRVVIPGPLPTEPEPKPQRVILVGP